MYGFLRAPIWIAGHLLMVAAVAFFVWAGIWQLSRLEERQIRNQLIEQRMAAPAEPLHEVLATTGGSVEDLVYRRVTVRGRYAPERELLTAPRSQDGRPVQVLLTPLETSQGERLLVQRGSIPYDRDQSLERAVAPPAGPVRVDGVLVPPEPGGDEEPARPLIVRVDPRTLRERTGMDLLPVMLLLREQEPATTAALLSAVDLPALDEGNHLSYAVQWFLFAVVALVGYPVLIRHRARETPDGQAGEFRPQRRQSRQMSKVASPTNSRRT